MSDLESRPPTLQDLVELCRRLNEAGARYVIVGGMAMLQLGFVRATEDIDLLIDGSTENESKVIGVLAGLPDQAASQIQAGEISKYQVIRVADEIVVDLMTQACGKTFRDAEARIDWIEHDGVRMPFASAELMVDLKQAMREKDRLDLEFLKARLSSS
jgi:Nucleotidyl transferase of unknown function (DUF2204)